MKVVAFNGSARKQGNTAFLLRTVRDVLEEAGIETETVALADKSLHGCTACMQCFENKNQHCAVTDDDLNECIDKMLAAEGILFGSPTYFANVSTEIKALIDRAGMTAKANEDMFKRKVGAAVVAVRRAGAIHVFNSINHFFTIGQMIIPGASYWNLGIGLDEGDVAGDEEGLQTMKTLGVNMAWLMRKLYG
jgi:multimeric flavodoxin WrbA